jgi:mono/diheme cytochrome c family protein
VKPAPLLPLVALLLAPACRQDMHDQPYLEPFERSSFFADQRGSRPLVVGTVARGELQLDDHLYRGTVDGELAQTFPFPVTAEVLREGRERYGVSCAVCHDGVGNGRGTVVQRGMKQPASFHVQRLVDAPPGYFFDVVTNGFGAMYDYSDRIPARERWAIVAYVRALQRSQNASIDDVPPAQRAALEAERAGGSGK